MKQVLPMLCNGEGRFGSGRAGPAGCATPPPYASLKSGPLRTIRRRFTTGCKTPWLDKSCCSNAQRRGAKSTTEKFRCWAALVSRSLLPDKMRLHSEIWKRARLRNIGTSLWLVQCCCSVCTYSAHSVEDTHLDRFAECCNRKRILRLRVLTSGQGVGFPGVV